MRSAVVFVHIVAATLALLAGWVATRRPNGTPVHRRAGRVYVLSWVCFASTGLWLGAAWKHQHLRWMLTSYAFVVVASANQLLLQSGFPPPTWMFWLMVAAPFFVLPPIVRRLRARFPVADRS